MYSPWDRTTRDKGGHRKYWSCFQAACTRAVAERNQNILMIPEFCVKQSCKMKMLQRGITWTAKRPILLVWQNHSCRTYLPQAGEWVSERETHTIGPPETVKLTSKTTNTLQGISTLHMLPHYFTASKFQLRAVKRQEGSVPAYIPIHTWQVWKFQIPFRCSSVNPPTCIPTNIQEHPEH